MGRFTISSKYSSQLDLIKIGSSQTIYFYRWRLIASEVTSLSLSELIWGFFHHNISNNQHNVIAIFTSNGKNICLKSTLRFRMNLAREPVHRLFICAHLHYCSYANIVYPFHISRHYYCLACTVPNALYYLPNVVFCRVFNIKLAPPCYSHLYSSQDLFILW